MEVKYVYNKLLIMIKPLYKKLKKLYIRYRSPSFLLMRTLLRLQPYSRAHGYERGDPIDRYYIEKFLYDNRELIKGDVLEVEVSTYTHKFGEDRVKKAMILYPLPKENADIIGNLETGDGITENLVDCFICTQTLCCIFDVQSAVRNAVMIVKPGGYLLVTVPGICQLKSDYEWGFYWNFTVQSLKKLFENVVPQESIIDIRSYGNVKTATCFLYGMSQQELPKSLFLYDDPDYQVNISAVIKVPE